MIPQMYRGLGGNNVNLLFSSIFISSAVPLDKVLSLWVDVPETVEKFSGEPG